MSSKTNLVKKIIKFSREEYASEKNCLLPGCSEVAINSHVIQKSQFLEPVADENLKLYHLDGKRVFPGKSPKFRRDPISHILTFKGFCQYHDQIIFSEIERDNFDLFNQKHLCLFNYRAICHELRKKENIVNWMNKIRTARDLDFKITQSFKDLLFGHTLGLKDLNFYKSKIESEIIENRKNYAFLVKKVPAKQILTSASFNIGTLDLENLIKMNDPKWVDKPLVSIVFSFFPKDGYSYIIVGYLIEHKEEVLSFVESMGGLNLQFANKVILEWIETWACSKEFYVDKIEPIRDQIIDICIGSNVKNAANTRILPNLMD